MDYGDFFRFTLQERRGILVFCSLIVVFICGARWLSPKPVVHSHDLSEFYLSGDSINNMAEDNEQYTDWDLVKGEYKERFKKYEKAPVKKLKFAFDPNVLSADSMMMLGFSKFASNNIVNYRSKGGKIYNADKFKQIFGVDSMLVNELQGLIRYPAKPEWPAFRKDTSVAFSKKSERVQQPVEINSADSITLDRLKGVGPYTVMKILRLRDRLGGFVSRDQLVELNAMPDSVYRAIEPYLLVDPSLIRKIDINTADFKTFTRHPYFASETANAIMKYRKQHGNFTDPAHISRIVSLKRETGLKILPYLKAE